MAKRRKYPNDPDGLIKLLQTQYRRLKRAFQAYDRTLSHAHRKFNERFKADPDERQVS